MSESSNAPLFRKEQVISHRVSRRFYIVRRTPDTCIHNNEPSYQLEMIGLGPKTPPFYRSKDDVERDWIVPAEGPKYGMGELLQLRSSKASYMVVGLPKFYRIEKTHEPAYILQGPDGIRNAIAQVEAEDGRYARVNKPPAPHYSNDE